MISHRQQALLHAPQPYGNIPRRKKTPTTLTRPHNMPLQPLSSSPSLHSLLFSNTPDSSRPTLWDSLKAHYHTFSSTLASTATSATANHRHQRNKSSRGLSRHRSLGSRREFSPPLALFVPNSAPVVTLDDTALILTSSAEDALLSLPNLGSLSSHASASGSYPASVKAMDKFKALRSDTIPLKTFTYLETPVVEVKRPITMPVVRKYAPKPPTKTTDSGNNTYGSSAGDCKSELQKSLQEENNALPLPRHLACREPRSNSDYLRMMASELCMIRSRKLIAPLKPRGTLARRKELFRNVKSSLSVAIELPLAEDDHPLNNLLVGSWSSVSSTESFLSATSSDYTTADESFE
ncbi:hypothetical protein BGZ83_004030 [Gryganskiella cystojenkinii]|nr:hypothetical protein BGZ83_004030 [Gryganskiella cystojenkinii]